MSEQRRFGVSEFATNADRFEAYESLCDRQEAEIDRLARLCEAKDAELKTARIENECLSASCLAAAEQLSEAQAQIAMKDADIKRLAISEVDLELKVHVLEAQIAMQAEALNPFTALLQEHNKKGANNRPVFAINDAAITLGDLRKATEAISETVAAWRAKETEPLRREVAMLRDVIERTSKEFRHGIHSADVSDLRTEALTNTQATALAYEREVKAKALEDAASKFDSGDWFARDTLQEMAAELRASKGEVK